MGGIARGGIGQSRSANVAFGFGDLSTDRYNVWGGLDVFSPGPRRLNSWADGAITAKLRRVPEAECQRTALLTQSSPELRWNSLHLPKTGAPVYLACLKTRQLHRCADRGQRRGAEHARPDQPHTTCPAGSLAENTDAYGEVHRSPRPIVAVSARVVGGFRSLRCTLA